MAKGGKEWTPERKAAFSKQMKEKKEAKEAEKLALENGVIPETEQEKPEKMQNENEERTIMKSDAQIDELREIIRKQGEDFERRIAVLTQDKTIGVTDDKSHKKFGTALRVELPADDRLKDPKTFIYVGGVYVMSVYMKNGTEVYAPLDRPITFIPSNMIPQQVNGETKYFYVSLYSTYSKKEVKFIENCPEYDMTIFTKMQDVQKKVDLNLTNQIQRASMYVNSLTEGQLLNEGQAYQIDNSLPMDEIRRELKAFKLAEILQTEKTKTQEVANRLFEHDKSQ